MSRAKTKVLCPVTGELMDICDEELNEFSASNYCNRQPLKMGVLWYEGTLKGWGAMEVDEIFSGPYGSRQDAIIAIKKQAK